MPDRGIIIHRLRARQINDFSNLQYERGITPTDIDVYMEFGGRLYIFGEVKYKDATMPRGQKVALERLVDAITDAPAVLFLARHDIEDPEIDVDIANAIVSQYRYEKIWRRDIVVSVKEFIDRVHRRFIN